jgi:hypothetical protein
MSPSLLSNNESFWLSFITIVSGIIGLGLRYAFKSKCSRVHVCCITCVRDVATEEKEFEYELQHTPNKLQQQESKDPVLV